MKLDIAVGALMALFGVLGYASGALKQLSQWVGLAAAYLWARPASAALTPLASKYFHRPQLLVGAILTSLFFLLFVILGSAIARFIFLKLFRDHHNGKADRAFGLMLGAGKAAVTAYAVLSVLLFIDWPQPQATVKIERMMKGSKAAAFTRRHNLFAIVHVSELDELKKMLSINKTHLTAAGLSGNPDIKALLDDPQVKKLLNDPNFTQRLSRLQSSLQNGEAENQQ